MNVFIPITKVDAVKREVWGIAAEEAPDKAKEVMDYGWSKPRLQEWSDNIAKTTGGASLGNVRAMHQPVAAGKLIAMQFDDENKKVYVGARIVDDNEWRKCEEGVYSGFSLGGNYGKTQRENNLLRYEAIPSEISIVDNPCMHGAIFTMVKADGATELKKFVGEPEPGSESQPSPAKEQGSEAAGELTKAEGVADGGEIKADLGDISADIASPATIIKLDDTPLSDEAKREALQTAFPNGGDAALAKLDDPAWDAQLAGYAVSDTASAMQFLSTLAGNMAGQFPAIAQRLAEAARVVGKGLQAATAQLEAATSAASEAKAALDSMEDQMEQNIQAAVDAAMTSDAAIEKVAEAVFAKFETAINASKSEALAKAAGQEAELTKRFDAVTAQIGAFDDRLAKVEARPAVAGPVLREVPLGSDGGVADEASQIAVLDQLIKSESNPTVSQALMMRRSELLIRSVHATGGNRIANAS